MFNILKLIYPEKCPKCDKALPIGEYGFCRDCADKLKPIREPYCLTCGKPVKINQDYCDKCIHGNFHQFDSGRILYPYSDVSDVLYRFKYKNKPEYAKALAKVAVEELDDWLMFIKPDALIPVPLHKNRLIKRGYNQAEELAKEISRLTKIPTETKLVYRVKNTLPLKDFDHEGRMRTLKNAFIVRESVVKLTTVVLVDDIFTTGSTIDAVSMSLHEAGVKNIYFLTVTAAGTQDLQI